VENLSKFSKIKADLKEGTVIKSAFFVYR